MVISTISTHFQLERKLQGRPYRSAWSTLGNFMSQLEKTNFTFRHVKYLHPFCLLTANSFHFTRHILKLLMTNTLSRGTNIGMERKWTLASIPLVGARPYLLNRSSIKKIFRMFACSAKLHPSTRIYINFQTSCDEHGWKYTANNLLGLQSKFQFLPLSTGYFDNFVSYVIVSVERCTKRGLCWVNSAVNRYTETLSLNMEEGLLNWISKLAFSSRIQRIEPRRYIHLWNLIVFGDNDRGSGEFISVWNGEPPKIKDGSTKKKLEIKLGDT